MHLDFFCPRYKIKLRVVKFFNSGRESQSRLFFFMLKIRRFTLITY